MDGTERFPPRFRIRKRHEYLALQRSGKRRRSEHFTVITSGCPGESSRLGVTTSRKVGNAPARNRVRRMVREFFRRNRSRIDPPRDVLVIARPGTQFVPYREISRELEQALGL